MTGGAVGDIPQIIAAKKMGFRVITSGLDATGVGHQYADEVHLADYSDESAMLEIVRATGAIGLCPACNDFAALSAAAVGQQLGFKGFDSVEVTGVLHFKDRFRELQSKLRLPAPQSSAFSNLDQASRAAGKIAYPLMIKPIDLTGGKGISVALNDEDYSQSIALAFHHSRSKRIITERFISGSRHGYSTFLVAGKVRFSFVDEESYFKNDFLVSGAGSGPEVDSGVLAELDRQIEIIATELSLVDGLFHAQFILSKESGPFLIEVCRRPPGDLYTRFVQIATGVDFPSHIVGGYLGNAEDLPLQTEPTKLVIRHCIMAPHNGVIRALKFDPLIEPKILERHDLGSAGDVVKDYRSYKAGIVMLRCDGIDEYRYFQKHLNDLIYIDMY